jgi:IS1 family transposase
MWSFVQRQAHQRGLWPAIDHLSGVVLAYAFGRRADTVCVELQKLLKPFGLEHCYTDGAGVYGRHLPAAGERLVCRSLKVNFDSKKHPTAQTRSRTMLGDDTLPQLHLLPNASPRL